MTVPRITTMRVLVTAGLTVALLAATGCAPRTAGTEPAATDGGSALTADCTSYEPTVGITDDEIKIGTSMPLTGALASAGTTRYGMLAYFDHLNAAGGIDGRKVTLVVRDDAYDPAKVTANINELVQEQGVFAIVGLLGTAGALAVQQDLQDQCIPNLLVLSGAPVISTEDQPWTVPMFPTYTLEASALAQAAVASGAKTLSILSENDDFGKAYVDGITAALEGTGIQITQQVTYDVGAPDVSGQVTQLASDDADAVLVAALGTKCPQVLNGIEQSGWDPLLLVGTLCTTKSLLSLLEGDAGANMVSTAWYKSPSDPAWADEDAMTTYREAVEQYQPDADPNEDFVLNGWLLAQSFEQMLRSADSLDRGGLMESARDADFSVDTMLAGVAFVTAGDKFHPIQQVQLQRFDKGSLSMVFISPETGEDLVPGETELTTGAGSSE